MKSKRKVELFQSVLSHVVSIKQRAFELREQQNPVTLIRELADEREKYLREIAESWKKGFDAGVHLKMEDVDILREQLKEARKKNECLQEQMEKRIAVAEETTRIEVAREQSWRKEIEQERDRLRSELQSILNPASCTFQSPFLWSEK